MSTFVRSVLIEAPVEEVFAFHERPDALALLSPAFPPVRMISRTGTGIEKGSRIELKVGPLRWIALHTAYEKDRRFVDEQVEGPFAHWVHHHEFAPEGPARTRLTDRIEYDLPVKLLNWAVVPGLHNMFRHRHRVTKKLLESGRRLRPQ